MTKDGSKHSSWTPRFGVYPARERYSRVLRRNQSLQDRCAHCSSWSFVERRGTEIWYEFIRLYYKLLPAFTHFIKSKKHRIEVLRLLQGEVFDRKEVPVLDAMRKFIHTVETTPGHAFAGVLSNISID